jgi:hypothetical protein
MNNFRKLKVWQEAMVSKDIYTKTFPIEERYGLTSQMMRAVVLFYRLINSNLDK